MTRRLPRRGLTRIVWTAALFGIAVLLTAAALLQYHWSAQIRQAMEVRLGADLESLMLTWHLNLYREFSTICIALQIGPDSGDRNHWGDYLRRYEEWRNAASNAGFVENIYSNPDVVSQIYIYETSRAPTGRLFRFNPDSDRIENSSIPVSLQSLLLRLQQRSSNLGIALRAWESEDQFRHVHLDSGAVSSSAGVRRPNPITGWQFDEDLPAIVHPLLHHGSNHRDKRAPVDWLVIVLNQDTIQRRIFPELAQRYFAGAQGLDYKLAVAAVGKKPRMLYSSDPDFGLQELRSSDSVMNIFGPPPESTEGSFWQIVKTRESLRAEQWRHFSGLVWFPVIQESSEPQQWMLFLQHRTGPIEASIGKAWRGNLLIGGFVLLLLATSMFFVVIASQRARALAKLQMDFVASISHDLRTPLAAILAVGQNLSDGFATNTTRYGGIITAQARHLINLVDQILIFVSMHDGMKKFQLTAVSLGEVFKKLDKTTLAILGNAGFQIECRFEKNLPHVLADQEALTRCLKNLLENAAKYSGNSRWISLSASLEDRDTGIRISVGDHGVGISPSELPRVFEPFYRTPSAISAQIHGTGLGLAVVKHLVEEMQGRVSVTSEIGVGSIFTLHLQIAEPLKGRNDIQDQEVVPSL
jgi:two-component system sensor histidine kinase SenX3